MRQERRVQLDQLADIRADRNCDHTANQGTADSKVGTAKEQVRSYPCDPYLKTEGDLCASMPMSWCERSIKYQNPWLAGQSREMVSLVLRGARGEVRTLWILFSAISRPSRDTNSMALSK